MKLSEHFSDSEFRCKHCGKLPQEGINPQLLTLLEKIRAIWDLPIIIISGYRCHEHNGATGGARTSQHLLGNAADIQVKGISPKEVQTKIEPIVSGGLGVYPGFTHIDVRRNKVRWTG